MRIHRGRAAIAAIPVAVAAAVIAACSGGGGSAGPMPIATSAQTNAPGTTAPAASPTAVPTASASATPAVTASPTPATTPSAAIATPPAQDSRLSIPAAYDARQIATVGGARELVSLPNGDLLVGTGGSSIYVVPNADGPGVAGSPHVFATLSETPAESIAYSAAAGAIFAATNTTIWRMPYTSGDQTESAITAIAHVRTGPVAPNSDGDVHTSTSVAVAGSTLYAGVGSSCNACAEADATRASVLQMHLDGSNMTKLATRTRNPIALAVDPSNNALWIGGAGQDNLTYGHPFEYFDSPTMRGASNVDYGWPQCEENHVAYNALKASPAPDCSQTVAPLIEFPAYSTLIGAVFYPSNQTGQYALPAPFRGGVFVTAHGSWHCCPSIVPEVWFVPMSGGTPATAVNWSNALAQPQPFITGFGSNTASSGYIARPTGLAIGPNGSLFYAEDSSGHIVRIRPKN